MKTVVKKEIQCIPNGEEIESDRVNTLGVIFSSKIGSPRYLVTLHYDDGTSEVKPATAEDISHYRRIMGRIDAGAPVF